MSQLFGQNNFFYHGMLRKYVAMFGSLFSELYIQRQSEDGIRLDVIKVPIKYGNGNMYIKAEQDESREYHKVGRILPAMAFEFATIYKDVSRKTNQFNQLKQISFDEDGKRGYQFNKVPYNIIFSLKIRTKNIEDMLQIVEQIVPAFDSNLCVTMQDSLNGDQDITIVLDEIKMDDNYDDEMKSRVIEYDITFEMKTYLYKQTISGYVVKEIDLVSIMEGGTLADALDNVIITDQTPITNKQNILPSITDLEAGLFAATGLPKEEIVTETKPVVRKKRKVK